MNAWVRAQNIVRVYKLPDSEVVALRGIDFEMKKQEWVAIVGPSGAGKSTLLNLLGGLDSPTGGKLTVDGQNLLELKGRKLAYYRLTKTGYLWQQVDRNLIMHRSALRNVTLPMMLAGIPPWERIRRARELLDAVGLLEHRHKRPSQLSGGQQQRVSMAVALANRPELLLADEPTGALDRKSSMQVIELLQRLRERYGLTILMVTHDMEIAQCADRVLTLRDGALGQNLTGEDDAPRLDDAGRIRLPEPVQATLKEAHRIAVEIRPEGVLLRPEAEASDDTSAILQEMLPQDAPPVKRGLFRRKKNTAKAK